MTPARTAVFESISMFKYLCLSIVLFASACTLLDVEAPRQELNNNVRIDVEFIESAPKDRFEIRNVGSCALANLLLELDLSQSAGKLIFDTTETGAGVEVFQPFEVVKGNIIQARESEVADGDDKLALQIADLSSGGSAAFTIDVDDTLPSSELGQIRVADSEIAGGVVTVTVDALEPTTAVFDDKSQAVVDLAACPPE